MTRGPQHFMIGQRLGHFLLKEVIGAGGMGEVYRARDERLQRDVAVKVLTPGTLANERARKRFRREALALSRLSHPHIATIYDFDTQEGVDFLVMELVTGPTLAEKLAGGRLPDREAARVGQQVAEALEEAHEHGIVHRDLKPGNIKLTAKGQVKVLDFGLAQVVRPSGEATTESLTDGHGVAGTLPYMSPEQLRGEPADLRSDIYALGAVLYECVTGRRPFPETLSTALVEAILHEPTLAPRALNGGVSAELERITLKCLEKDPANRYQSATDLAVDLRQLASGTTRLAASQQAPAGTGHRSLPRSARRPLLLGIGLVLLLGAVVAFSIGHVRNAFSGGGQAGLGQIRSLAVLPLENLSGDPQQEYFADGMTEELIADLSKLHALRVISRTSVMQYKGTRKSLPEIAKELHVDVVVEGAVLKAGGRVRITAQLIQATTDQGLWANSYERDLKDVLSLQDEVSRAIADEIRVQLTPLEQTRLASARAIDPDAYQDYLRGLYAFNQRTGESVKESLDYFQKAVARDPDFGPAYAALSFATNAATGYGVLSPADAYPRVRAAATRALELDGTLGMAHASLGLLDSNERKWADAEAEYRRALDVSPGDPTAHYLYGFWFLAPMGRFGEAAAQMNKALELDPVSLIVNTNLADLYYFEGRYDESIKQLRRVLELDPSFSGAHMYLSWDEESQGDYVEAIREAHAALESSAGDTQTLAQLAYAYARGGQKDEARKVLAQLQAQSLRRYVSPYDLATIHTSLDARQQALSDLEEAERLNESRMVFLRVDRRFEPLHAEPRFQALLRRMNFPQ
jgi:eukaryotic-like serine/threonine-protein kinase